MGTSASYSASARLENTKANWHWVKPSGVQKEERSKHAMQWKTAPETKKDGMKTRRRKQEDERGEEKIYI